jgi:hypothetical protein
MKTLRVFICPVVSPSISVKWESGSGFMVKRDIWYMRDESGSTIVTPRSGNNYLNLLEVPLEENIKIELDPGIYIEQLLTCPCELVRKVAKRYVEVKDVS